MQLPCPQCGFANTQGAKFCGGCGQPTGAGTPPSATPAQPAAERRQLTVMFCDLVDSTRLSTLLDPEDHHEVLRAYQSACAQVITRYGGYIAQFLGDGIMAYFGYPKAHEDAAEQSVLAGLGVVEAVSKLRPLNLAIHTRVGIATGLVVVGDKIAKGEDWEIGVVGETPNLAARIQGVAQPGTVAIGPATRRLLGGQFAYEELGPQPFKGFAEPVPVWRVLAERRVESRFKAVRGFQTPLVDRRAEQALLQDLGGRAVREACQTVLILGEAGIGKSRLAHALAEWMGGQGGVHLVEMQCSAYHTQSALFPAINPLWQIIFDGVREADGLLAWNKLGRFLGGIFGETAGEAQPLFANLLSIPAPEGHIAPAFPPERQRQLTLQCLLDLFVQGGGGRPVLLLIEDLHWADPSTLELVEHIVEHGGNRPLLALFTSRPGFAPRWTGSPGVTLIPLSRLPHEDAAELVRQTLGGEALAEEVVASVVAKTDGIPLYLQEYTKAVAEARQPGERDGAIPSTLQDLLLARLDRLGEAKLVAQTAALLGREFDGRLLEAVWASGGNSLRDGLGMLLREEVVYAVGDSDQPRRYVFRHALIQEAAYESLLKSSRAALHLRIAEVVERDFKDIAAAEPEWLARHFSQAGQPSRAIPYWERAGQRASKLAAHTEAGRHFKAALAQLAKLPEEPARHRLELGLRLQLGLALTASLGYAASEMKATYQRALELCDLLGNPAELFPVLRGLATYCIASCDFDRAIDLSKQLLRLGEETGRPDYQIDAYYGQSYSLFYTGALLEAEAALNETLRLYKVLDGGQFDGHTTETAYTGCLSMLGLVSCVLGQARRSSSIKQALEENAENIGRPFDQAYSYGFLVFTDLVRGQYNKIVPYSNAMIQIAKNFGYSIWLDVGDSYLALAEGHLGNLADAIPALRASLDRRIASGTVALVQYFILELAEFHRRAGQVWEALAAVEEAAALALGHGELWFAAEYPRRRGELLLSLGEREKGEAELREAIKLARGQGAKLCELRAALGLRRLAPDAQDARALLERAFSQIEAEDGVLIPEWGEAEKLLNETLNQ